MAKKYCFAHGKIVPLSKFTISPYDLGILRGYGVFDFMITVNNKPFLWREHYRRLVHSGKELHLTVPLSEKKYGEVLSKLLRKNAFKKASIRTMLTGGMSSNGFLQDGTPTFYILMDRRSNLPKEYYQNGARVITMKYGRHLPQAKVTNYVEAIRNNTLRQKKKALEMLYVKDGKVLEASTSNFFLVKGKKIVTAKDDVLLGITRNIVMKLARKHFTVEERIIREMELRTAEEAFLTASNKHVLPVVMIDGRKVGSGKVGEKTRILMKLYNDFVKKY